MAQEQKKQEAGAPAWMVTYGDMVTLLLTFFVMLVSIANFEIVDDKFTAAVQSIREALGMTGQVGNRVDASIDFHSLLNKLESILPPQMPRDRGDSDEEGIYGEHFRIRNIREGSEITLGGPLLFEPFSDELTAEGRKALEEIGAALRGHRNKIEIRGHAADEPRPADWTHKDAWRLSYARAVHVAEELVARGVTERAIRIVAVGASEPVAPPVYDPRRPADNRRVEIVVRESLIEDYTNRTGVPATLPHAETTLPVPAISADDATFPASAGEAPAEAAEPAGGDG